MGVHLMGVHLMSVHLVSVYLMGVHLIYESSLRVGHGWRESLYRHPGWLKSFWLWATRPSGCWSPLERAPRGEKLPKRLLNGLGAAEAKAAALHPEWNQSLLPKLSTREGGRGGEKKRRQSDWRSGGKKESGTQTDRS